MSEYRTRANTYTCPEDGCRGCEGCYGEDDTADCACCDYVFEGPTGFAEHQTWYCQSCDIRACAGCVGEDDPSCDGCGLVFEHTSGPFDDDGNYIGGAESFNAPYAGAGALMAINQNTPISNFTTNELTHSSTVQGDFNQASINSSGHQNLEVRGAEMKDSHLTVSQRVLRAVHDQYPALYENIEEGTQFPPEELEDTGDYDDAVDIAETMQLVRLLSADIRNASEPIREFYDITKTYPRGVENEMYAESFGAECGIQENSEGEWVCGWDADDDFCTGHHCEVCSISLCIPDCGDEYCSRTRSPATEELNECMLCAYPLAEGEEYDSDLDTWVKDGEKIQWKDWNTFFYGAESFGAEYGKRQRFGNRYIARDTKGRIISNVSVGRSLKADRRNKSKTPARIGFGHKGDSQKGASGGFKLPTDAKSVIGIGAVLGGLWAYLESKA